MLRPTVVTKPKMKTMFDNNQGRSLVRTGKGLDPRTKSVSVFFYFFFAIACVKFFYFISALPSNVFSEFFLFRPLSKLFFYLYH